MSLAIDTVEGFSLSNKVCYDQMPTKAHSEGFVHTGCAFLCAPWWHYCIHKNGMSNLMYSRLPYTYMKQLVCR